MHTGDSIMTGLITAANQSLVKERKRKKEMGTKTRSSGNEGQTKETHWLLGSIVGPFIQLHCVCRSFMLILNTLCPI